MILLRVFIPTWRFFDRVGARPRAFGLFGGEWRPLFPDVTRRWWRAMFNPGGNLRHANQNLVDRLLEESQASADVADLVSYQLVEHLARAGGADRFKLVVGDEDVLTSPEFTS